MNYCNKCNQHSNSCSCSKTVVNNNVNSDQAGRDGLSAYQIAVKTHKFTGTESAFVDWNRGEKGDKGEKGDPGLTGAGVWTNTEW